MQHMCSNSCPKYTIVVVGSLPSHPLLLRSKQSYLELPDLFPEHLACIINTEDERSCQGWPEVTAKRLGLYCDESDVSLDSRGDGKYLICFR